MLPHTITLSLLSNWKNKNPSLTFFLHKLLELLPDRKAFIGRKNFYPIVCCNPFVLRKGCKINTKASRFSMSMAAPTIYFRLRLSWQHFSVQKHFRQHVGERSLVGVLTFRWWCQFFYIFILNIWVKDFLVGLWLGVSVLVSCLFFYLKKNLMCQYFIGGRKTMLLT